MKKIEFTVTQNSKLSDYICKNFPKITYSMIQKCLRQKDVLVNEKRITKEQKLASGDKVCLFIDETKLASHYKIFYEDENILVVDKMAGIEVCDGDYNLLDELKTTHKQIFAVHRIDRNTTGLVVFAKTLEAKNILDKAFSSQNIINKIYVCEVLGVPKPPQGEFVDFLLKNSELAEVKIFKKQVAGSQQIITRYKTLKTNGDTSLLEISLLTGKTHQIRAHLAHYGLPILGDNKYGDVQANKSRHEKEMKLCAEKIVFNFDEKCRLFYLNDKKFEKNCNFLKKYV